MKEVRILVTTDVEDHTKKSKTFHSMQIALEKALSLKGVNIIEKELVKIDQSPTYMDWFRFREEFNKFTSEKPPDKPDIIYIRATEKMPPPGMDIQYIIRCLKNNYIVITNAMCIRGPVSPHAFPGDSVIAVGSKGDKVHGSTLDFIMEPCKQIIRNRSNKEASENTEKDVINRVVEVKDAEDNILKDIEDKVFEEHEEEKVLHAKENDALIEMQQSNEMQLVSNIKDPKHTAKTIESADIRFNETENVKDKGAEAEKNQPWEASLEAVGIAAVILLKAQYLSK